MPHPHLPLPTLAPSKICVAIVVPVLNEAASIDACLQSLVDQEGGEACEILVMDGGSTDGTQSIVAGWHDRHARISLHSNAKGRQSAALNQAAEIASPAVAVIVRADAHAVYPRGFVRDCVDALRAHDATSVVVPLSTVGRRGFQVAVAAAQSSRLGTGGSPHRSAGASGFVDHGHHAAFDRAFFRRVGGYDESFTHNEDAEHDIRALAAGGRIWLCMEAAVTYFPRTSLHGLARQYRNHGRGRAKTLLLHGVRPKLRQIVPLGSLVVLVGSVALMPLNPWMGMAPLAYASVCLAAGIAAAWRARDLRVAAAGAATMTMHQSWAWGFLEGVLEVCRGRLSFGGV